ncbi:acyl-CoA dehydrogenase [Halioxenophilus aromaticivorans]|uniref:Acyl-CoA dehydrogenase n=1 Tax=Halioxenophilus aromaticivorans TaxID=1306992 RepID=A0AAV3U266_9ALTE
MSIPLLNERDINFLLYELLDTESLLSRPRYQEHSKEVFNAVLDTAHKLAEKYFANHNAKGDAHEPRFVDGKVEMIPETKVAWQQYAEAGFLSAHCDMDAGGMQLPEIIVRAANAYFSAANTATSGYSMLSVGAANLIDSFGSEQQQQLFLPPMREGRFSGTMALTEPAQGSSLADITTTATAHEDGSYRIHGQKMYISGGDQNFTDNIIHMVLARIKGAPAGVKGISLFIVPKFLVNDDGSLGPRNDVALAGLLHKMGYRNTTSTVLSFGEQDGAVGYLVGEPHHGITYMFQMMNEARIAVGTGAATIAYQGFNAALDYAKGRPQGRLPDQKSAQSKQVNIIEHADVRAMLLAQKAYAEGSLALCFIASSLFEDSQTADSKSARLEAHLLLDLLTPVVKSWPSRYGLKANELAIQIYGGAGYIREYPVEQLYRDQRLNPIHEGTEGIQALDLLGRKVISQNGEGLKLLLIKIQTCLAAARKHDQLAEPCEQLAEALETLQTTTQVLCAHLATETNKTLANASVYLDMFGRVVMAWVWLQQADIACRALAGNPHQEDQWFYRGKLQTARFYLLRELPEVEHQARLLQRFDSSALDMDPHWFAGN